MKEKVERYRPIIKNKICVECNSEFTTLKGVVVVCSEKCKEKRGQDKRNAKKIKGKIEGIDYIICKWDNFPVFGSMANYISKAFGKDKKAEYFQQYPNDPTETPGHKEKREALNERNMSNPVYVKMLSDRIKGDNNPSRKEKDPLKRSQKSSYSIEFYKKKYPNNTIEENQKLLDEFIIRQETGKLKPNHIEYWTKKGFTPEEAKIKVGNHQRRDLAFFQKKHGEEEGLKFWTRRQEKWLSNFKRQNYSAISQELFWSVYNRLDNTDNIHFAMLNSTDNKNCEYRLKLGNKIIVPDFIKLDSKKIIEFDSVYYHRETPENKTREEQRDKLIFDHGYTVLHINENEYKKNKELIINKCVEFINANI